MIRSVSLDLAASVSWSPWNRPLAGIDAVLEAWRQRTPRAEGPEYILVDEAQFIREWGTWINHQVDFFRGRRIIFTGSAVPLLESDPESGVGDDIDQPGPRVPPVMTHECVGRAVAVRVRRDAHEQAPAGPDPDRQPAQCVTVVRNVLDHVE